METMRKRKEETKSKKLQKMREVLNKQGLIILDATIGIEEKVKMSLDANTSIGLLDM